MTITEAKTPDEYASAKALMEEYAASLGINLCFQNVSEELANLKEVYGPSRGCLLLAREAEAFVGCVAVRPVEPEVFEMKQLYVRPDHRRCGLGRSLAAAALVRARRLGYRRMVLDTLPRMTEAQSLYESLGFREVKCYHANPLQGVRYLGIDLSVNS
jgi:ribosomal protein S18 acetylase RimI-like enzyme